MTTLPRISQPILLIGLLVMPAFPLISCMSSAHINKIAETKNTSPTTNTKLVQTTSKINKKLARNIANKLWQAIRIFYAIEAAHLLHNVVAHNTEHVFKSLYILKWGVKMTCASAIDQCCAALSNGVMLTILLEDLHADHCLNIKGTTRSFTKTNMLWSLAKLIAILKRYIILDDMIEFHTKIPKAPLKSAPHDYILQCFNIGYLAHSLYKDIVRYHTSRRQLQQHTAEASLQLATARSI